MKRNGIKGWIICGIGVVVLMLIVGSMVKSMLDRYTSDLEDVKVGTEVITLLSNLVEQENQSFHVKLDVDAQDKHIAMESRIYLLNNNNRLIGACAIDDYTLYFTEEAVFLENGKAFRLLENMPVIEGNNISLLKQILQLFRMTEIRKSIEKDTVRYSITPTADVRLAITVKGNQIKTIEVTGKAILNEDQKDKTQMTVVLSEFEDASLYQLPAIVMEAIETTDTEELPVMGEHMYHLILAWMNFDEEQTGDVYLDVSCGALKIETEHAWEDIRNAFNNAPSDTKMGQVPQVIYGVCLSGEFSCDKTEATYLYKIELDEATMRTMVQMLAPEVGSQVECFDNGTVTIEVREDEIQSFSIRLDGSIDLLITQIETYIQAKFVFHNET